jgi:cytochrome P450
MRDLSFLGISGAAHATFPLLSRLVRALRLPIPMIRDSLAVRARIRDHARELLMRHFEMVRIKGTEATPTLLSKLYEAGEAGMSFEELREEALTFIVAGSDTVANTLAYLVWAVCKHEAVKLRLVEELRSLPEEFDDHHLRQLTYLGCVIEETLRLYPAAPTGLLREVPAEGAFISGHWIPGGTTVSAQAWSFHRHPEAFPDPERFYPERWESPTLLMKDYFIPFGAGSRGKKSLSDPQGLSLGR